MKRKASIGSESCENGVMVKTPVLVSLVGRSPIPILIGCRDLAPADASHLLVCTPQTEGHARRISLALGSSSCEVLVLEDGKSPHLVLQQLEEWTDRNKDSDLILNYTGGTKAMSAASVACLAASSGSEMWYLDESSNTYRSFLGETLQAGLIQSVEEVLFLHGWAGRARPPFISPTWKELCAFYDEGQQVSEASGQRLLKREVDRFDPVAARVIDLLPDNRRLSGLIKDFARTSPQSLISNQNWRDICDFNQNLPQLISQFFPSCSGIFRSKKSTFFDPSSPWTSRKDPGLKFLKEAATFLQGGWLEEFVRQGMGRALEGRVEAVQAAYEIWPDKNDVPWHELAKERREVDSLILRSNGLTLVSVTRSVNSSALREKLYEAMSVVQAMGGDLGSALVVAPADGEQIRTASLETDGHKRGWICGWDLLDLIRSEDNCSVRNCLGL